MVDSLPNFTIPAGSDDAATACLEELAVERTCGEHIKKGNHNHHPESQRRPLKISDSAERGGG